MGTNLLLLRHGESLGNSLKIMAGQYDVDLSERGLLQAEAAAEYISTLNVDAIYSSDLIRAHKTALASAKKCGLSVTLCEGLREIFIGDWEGVSQSELREKFGDALDRYFGPNFAIFEFDGGESTASAEARFEETLIKIAKENEGKTVLVAAHAGVIRALWGKISGIEPKDVGREVPFSTNASITTVFYNGEQILPVKYSENHYLSEVGFIKFTP